MNIRRKMNCKKIIIGLIVWHVIAFYGFFILMTLTLKEEDPFCFCGSNLFTNTIYVCTKNTFLSHFSSLIPVGVSQPTYLNPYSFFQPMKMKTLNMVCGK